MIKQIKTSKFEGLAVLVPSDSFNYVVRQNAEVSDLWYESRCGDSDVSNCIELPTNKYLVLATSTSITEEQCADIVPQMKDSGYPFEIEDYKVTFENLLRSIGCTAGTWLILKKTS